MTYYLQNVLLYFVYLIMFTTIQLRFHIKMTNSLKIDVFFNLKAFLLKNYELPMTKDM